MFAYELGISVARKFVVCHPSYMWGLINVKFKDSLHFYEVLHEDLQYTLYLDVDC